GRLLGGASPCRPMRQHEVRFESDQFGRKDGKAILCSLGPSVLQDDILSLHIAEVTKPSPECLKLRRVTGCRGGSEEPYPGNFPRMLRPRWKAKSQEHGACCKSNDFFTHCFSCSLLSAHCWLSFDHFVRPRQHVRRNRQADLLRDFQIDDELELLRLLYREISRLGAFQDLVHVGGSTPEQVGIAWGVGQK